MPKEPIFIRMTSLIGTADETVAVKKMTFAQALKFKQTWAFAFGKFMTDGVWWFFLFWTPAYLKKQYGMSPSK